MVTGLAMPSHANVINGALLWSRHFAGHRRRLIDCLKDQGGGQPLVECSVQGGQPTLPQNLFRYDTACSVLRWGGETGAQLPTERERGAIW